MADGSHEGFKVGEDVDGRVVKFRVGERGISVGAFGTIQLGEIATLGCTIIAKTRRRASGARRS
jgi:hypothetical protein